jgi:hypothetical protein
VCSWGLLQVLTGVGDSVDRAPGLGALLARDEGADVDDPLALLARDIRAQSSGLVVLGRSSFSLNSSTHAAIRWLIRMPRWFWSSQSLIAIFFARLTMFSIMAPELKSLKYRTSLSPLAYVTSRKRFSSLSAYMRSTVRWIIEVTVSARLPPCSARSSASERECSELYFDGIETP